MSLSIGIIGLPNAGPTSSLLKKGLRPLLSVRTMKDCTSFLQNYIFLEVCKCLFLSG